jgi:large subunit ribosomal protein L33
MAKGAREKIKLKSTESKECYWTTKNKRTKNTTKRSKSTSFSKKLSKSDDHRELLKAMMNFSGMGSSFDFIKGIGRVHV